MLIEIKKKQFMEFQDPNMTYYLPLNTYYDMKHSKTKCIMNIIPNYQNVNKTVNVSLINTLEFLREFLCCYKCFVVNKNIISK